MWPGNVGGNYCGLELQTGQLSIPMSRLRVGWSFMQAAVSAGMFVASFHHTKKGCLLFVNLLCSLQAGLVAEPHPCQELRAQRWGS